MGQVMLWSVWTAVNHNVSNWKTMSQSAELKWVSVFSFQERKTEGRRESNPGHWDTIFCYWGSQERCVMIGHLSCKLQKYNSNWFENSSLFSSIYSISKRYLKFWPGHGVLITLGHVSGLLNEQPLLGRNGTLKEFEANNITDLCLP